MSADSQELYDRAGIEVRPLSPALGAEVRGLDLGRAMDDTTFAAVHRAWLEHIVLLFRDQPVGDAQLVAFSRCFGDLDESPPFEHGPSHVAGYPEVLVISNVIENGLPIGALGSGECIWHTDMSFAETPPKASALHALEVPPANGRTGFMNMYAVWESLPGDLKDRLRGARLRHDSSTNSAGLVRRGEEPVTDVSKAPGAVHPAVRTHPETGRPALYLGRRRNAYVEGLSIAESETLLDALWAYTREDRFAWYHDWRVGDTLLWDNRCAMHRREPFDENSRRVMHRTQIRGDNT